jgi:hypothetical protein
MRHCASTIVQRCITLGKTSVYSTGRQNFGLKYGSKFLMESLQDLMINWWNLIFPIPNPHQPPLTFFDISFSADLKIKVISTNKPRNYQFKCLFILRFWHRKHFNFQKNFETLHLPENESYLHNFYLWKYVILLFYQICDQAGWVTKYTKYNKKLKLHLKYQSSEFLRTIPQNAKNLLHVYCTLIYCM